MSKKHTLVYVSIIILLFLDLITKTIFTSKHYFIDRFLYISYTENYGSSFGIFSNFTLYSETIAIFSILIVAFLFYNRKYFLKNQFLSLTLIFLIAGILGNTYDRLVFGFVRDFISLKYFFTFNLADFYISISFIFILIQEYSENKVLKTQKSKKNVWRVKPK